MLNSLCLGYFFGNSELKVQPESWKAGKTRLVSTGLLVCDAVLIFGAVAARVGQCKQRVGGRTDGCC